MTETLPRPGQLVDPVTAMDTVFRDGSGSVVNDAGALTRLALHQWLADPDAADEHLFLRHCSSATLDIGCGPGRLVAALVSRNVDAYGIDVSRQAVLHTRRAGGRARVCDVFGPVPRAGSWHTVLLADGNIGIGGNPVELLTRVHDLLRPGGTALVETEPTSTGVRHERLRVRFDGQDSAPFSWAFVASDALPGLAASAGLVATAVHERDGRHVAVLGRPR